MQPEPMPEPSPPSRRPMIVAVAVVGVIVLLLGGLVAYLAGVFDAESKFEAAPDVCAAITPGLGLLGAGFTAAPDGERTCVAKREDGPGRLSVRVNFKTESSPGDAGKGLRKAAEGQAAEVSGLGDQGYRQGYLTAFRISNLIVLCVVITDSTGYENKGTTEAKVRAFEADLADRLAR